MHSICIYHYKTKWNAGELDYISFFKIKPNYKNKYLYFLKYALYFFYQSPEESYFFSESKIFRVLL